MKCEFIKPDGQKCEAYAIKDSEFCYFHNPDISDEEKKIAQTNGGANRALTLKEPLPELPIASQDDAVLLVADTINRVRAGKLDIRTANCLGFLADKLLKALEASQTNDKLEKIERLLTQRQKNY